MLTTKSIGPESRLGYREPILTQHEPGSFTNAVGLTNPGAVRSAELMSQLRIPEDRFLLISIFGGSVEEYVEVAKIMDSQFLFRICYCTVPAGLKDPWKNLENLEWLGRF